MKADSRCEWTKELPITPGRYLRNNPPVAAVVLADVVETDGVLRNYRVNAGCGSVPVEQQRGFWWYGPIPPVPEDE